MSCRNSHNLFKSSRNGFEKIALNGTESESSLEGSDFLLVDSIKNYWGLQKNIGGFYKMALPDCKVIL